MAVGVGVGVGLGACEVVGSGAGERDGVGDGEALGLCLTINTPLLHTNFFPDLMHVYFFPKSKVVVPNFLHIFPGVTDAFADIVGETKKIKDKPSAICFLMSTRLMLDNV